MDPALSVSQYAHTAWTAQEGFFKGRISAIAQTPDGYLWLGTEFGLFRFDGVRNIPWQPPAGQQLPSTFIRSLLTGRDGRLWIGSSEGLAAWKDGKLTRYPELDGQSTNALLEDREGTLWVGLSGVSGNLCTVQSDHVLCYGKDQRFGGGVLSLHQDDDGSLWVGAMTSLWRWKPGPPQLYPLPASHPEIQSFAEGDRGTLLIAMNGGIRQIVNGEFKTSKLAPTEGDVSNLVRDRDGGIWIGTQDHGLLHVHKGNTDVYSRSDGLSSVFVSALFEDREGSIWVATLNGLHRFRDFAVPTISLAQGLSDELLGTVLAARDGSIWLGTFHGANRWKDGHVTVYHIAAQAGPGANKGAVTTLNYSTAADLPDDLVTPLYQDDRGRVWFSTRYGMVWFEDGRLNPLRSMPSGTVLAMTGDKGGNLWMSDQEHLTHLVNEVVVEQIPWAALGHKDWADALAVDPARGGVWLGFRGGGVAYFNAGHFEATYTRTESLGSGRVNDLHFGGDGALWVATQNGVSRIKDGSIRTLSTKNGMPCDDSDWIAEDDSHSFWISTACGVVRVLGSEMESWIASTSAGTHKQKVQTLVLDNSDGVIFHKRMGGYSPRVSKAVDGKLWFLPLNGVSILDPRSLHFNGLPPPVHIEEITADGKAYQEASTEVRLPARVRDLQIDYTALSLAAPEKVRFRYRLEKVDRDWQEVGNRRQAFYSNLTPGSYRFRVIASNNSGVWNEAGASYNFSIAPAYYQTTWFPLLCAVVLVALLVAAYRFRLMRIADEFNMRLEERVNERTRIARELHDTLLQSFQGSMIQMLAARNLFSRRPEQAVQAIDDAVTMAEVAIAESRDAIQDLRLQPSVQADLAQLLTVTAQDLMHHGRNQEAMGVGALFRVTVEGERHELDPLLQDEAYRIGRELLRNAFRHAHASQIEAEIRYEERLFRMRIRDDGKGIEPETLQAGGRDGHWGLLGMHERAKRIGGQLNFWSGIGVGTEAELSIPSSVAYCPTPRAGRRQLFR